MEWKQLEASKQRGNSMTYQIWENEPAPNRGGDWKMIKAGGQPFDEDWELMIPRNL